MKVKKESDDDDDDEKEDDRTQVHPSVRRSSIARDRTRVQCDSRRTDVEASAVLIDDMP